jgi:ribosome-binding protein aMBF1 (putative translation factor)
MSQFDDRGQRPKDDPLQKAFKDVFRLAKHPERWETEQDSRLFIRDLMKEEMEKQGISPEALAQITKLPQETIQSFLDGKADLSDSEPITTIERALKVNLSAW